MAELDARLAAWLEKVNTLQEQRLAAGCVATPIGAREALASLTAKLVSAGPDLPWVNEALVNGGDYPVPLRIYHPAPEQARPLLLFCHGGGHVAGSVTVYDPICRRLAQTTGCVVIAPEYRLAPENPYPAALHDIATVIRGLRPTLNARGVLYQSHLTLMGDSGGGALAATLAQWAQQDDSLRCDKLVLIYPSLDYTLSQPSIRQLGKGLLLESERIEWYFEQYFRLGGNRRAASPLFTDITMAHPPTLLISAGFDPLRDEAKAYAGKLRAAGVSATYQCMEGQIHAFLMLEALVPEVCDGVYQRVAAFLK